MSIKSPDIPIVVLVAGNNSPSNADALAEQFMVGLREVEYLHAQKVRIADLDIEHFSLQFYQSGTDQGEDFRRLHGMIDKAKAIVIATPIWNFSVPAHLKNLIDRMGAFALDTETRNKGTLGGKPVFLIFTGGASDFAWNSMMEASTSNVREAMKYFGATVTGTHFEPKCVKGTGKFGVVVQERKETMDTLKKRGNEFGEVVSTFAQSGKLPTAIQAKARFYKVASWAAKKFT